MIPLRLYSTIAVRHHRGLDVVFYVSAIRHGMKVHVGASTPAASSVIGGSITAVGDGSLDGTTLDDGQLDDGMPDNGLVGFGRRTRRGRILDLPATVERVSDTILILKLQEVPVEERPPTVRAWSYLQEEGRPPGPHVHVNSLRAPDFGPYW